MKSLEHVDGRGRDVDRLVLETCLVDSRPVDSFHEDERPPVDDRVGARDANGGHRQAGLVEGGHDLALAEDIRRPGDARSGRGEAQHVARGPLGGLGVDEIGEAGMSLGDQLDGLQSELGTLGKRVPNDRFEVSADLIAHSRCATSPSAPTMRRSPSARTMLMLVKYGYMRRWPGSRCSTSVR